MDLKPGQLLGSYRIEERLVSGGMAKVYRALQPSTNREVAIKVLPATNADAAAIARFEREMRVVAGLQHPHILGLIDAGRQGQWHYLVLPLVRSGDLGDLIAREDGPLPLAAARRIALQLCDALEYAHGQGIVHRDMKPDNVLLDERGNCLLTDFGIAMADDGERLTLAGQTVGTPQYLAPEQASGLADARSDVYALGVIVFQMVTGRMPFEAHTASEWLQAHRSATVPAPSTLNPALPAAIDAVILKVLEKQPGDRYRNATEFAAALRAALPESEFVDRATLVQGAPIAAVNGKSRNAHWLLIATAAAIAIVVLLALAPRSERTPAGAPVAAQPVAVEPPAALVAATQNPPPPSPSEALAAAPAGATADATPQSSPLPSAAEDGAYDNFDNRSFEGRYDPARWQPTLAGARMRFEQRSGSLHVRSQEHEHGLYARFAATQLTQVIARIRMNAPVTAGQASLGITLSRLDQPGRWVSCYVYAVRGSTTATPACTDQRRSEFRTGAVAALDSWHDVALTVDGAGARVLVALDGSPAGELPFAATHGPGTWYLLLSGWSADGQAVDGDIDDVGVARSR